jgi:RNA polymerase sigma-70 factor (ECF subfamily)
VSAAFGLPVSDANGDDARASAPSLGASIDAIYREHFAAVWRGLRRLGVPEASLEDAAQDVFLIVHRRASEFEGRSSPRTWIYGIAVRVAKDYRRSQARYAHRVERLAEHLIHQPPDPRTPADEVERREANRLLHAALAALGEEQREVLVLVELEQLPVREAATALGIRIRTCQRRLRAARAAFEAALSARSDYTRRSHE